MATLYIPIVSIFPVLIQHGLLNHTSARNVDKSMTVLMKWKEIGKALKDIVCENSEVK